MADLFWQFLEGFDPLNYEFSLANEYFLGQTLIPQVRTQEPDTCVFYALSYAAEMQLRLNRWGRGLPSDVVFDAYNFSVLYNHHVAAQRAANAHYRDHRIHTAFQLFQHIGIFATSSAWPERRTVRLAGWQRHPILSHPTVFDFLRVHRRPIVGVIPVTADFDNLAGNAIYDLDPAVLAPVAAHMVLFIGFGMREGRPYLVFLNSHGPDFGENGIGRVYFNRVVQDQHVGFYTLTIDDPDENSSAGTPPPTCGPQPPPGGPRPPPPPGGSAPGGSAGKSFTTYVSAEQTSERATQCSPSYACSN